MIVTILLIIKKINERKRMLFTYANLLNQNKTDKHGTNIQIRSVLLLVLSWSSFAIHTRVSHVL